MGLTRNFAGDLQVARRGTEDTTANLTEREAKLSELDFKFQLLAEETGCAGGLQKRWHAKKKKLELVKKDSEAKELVVKERSHDKAIVKSELKGA